MKRLAEVLTIVALLSNVAGFWIPGIQEYLKKTWSVPVGCISLVCIVLWILWIRGNGAKRELEQAKATPAGASQPRQPEPQWKTESERFPEHGVLYALEYPLDGQGDLASRISVSEPRCLAHPGAPMVRTSLEEGAEEDWAGTNVYRGWKCEGCGHTIPESLNKRLKVLARSNLIRRLSGIQPEAVAA